jgi:hypothetical protein
MREILDQRLPAPAEIGYDARHGARRRRRRMQMARSTRIAAMNIGAVAEDESQDWYDTEHLPERQRVPGFLTCARWIGVQDRRSSVVTCDLETLAVIKSPGYLAMRLAFERCMRGA